MDNILSLMASVYCILIRALLKINPSTDVVFIKLNDFDYYCYMTLCIDIGVYTNSILVQSPRSLSFVFRPRGPT